MPAPLPRTNLVSKLADKFAPQPSMTATPESATFIRNVKGEMERFYPEQYPGRFEEMRRKILLAQMQGGVSPRGLMAGSLK